MHGSAQHTFCNSSAGCKVVCQLHACCAADDTLCNIFQMSPCEVTVYDLPCEWTLKNKKYNTATLPCSHSFHVSALALHFVLTDMRCPVCRCGHECQADVESLPLIYQAAFEAHKKKIRENHDRSEWMHDVLENVEIHVAPLEHDLSLVVDICQANVSRSIIQTPLRTPMSAPDQTFCMFRVQNSFLRNFNAALHDTMTRTGSADDVHITFSLVHPVYAMQYSVQSVCIPFVEFVAMRSETAPERAWPILVNDNGEARTAGAIVTSNHGIVRQLGIFVDRQLVTGLCMASIHVQLQDMLQE